MSGTPVENTVNDLWTQMSFINPGLLGSQTLFYTEFVIPIEKKKDEENFKQRLDLKERKNTFIQKLAFNKGIS